jgi:hypothetical protein
VALTDNVIDPPRLFVWRNWAAAEQRAEAHRVEFGPAHVVFYVTERGRDGQLVERIVRAELVAQVGHLTEVPTA